MRQAPLRAGATGRVGMVQAAGSRAVADGVLDNLQRGDFEAVVDLFTDRMRAAVPAAEIRRVWTSVVQQGGRLEERGEPLEARVGGLAGLLGGRRVLYDFPLRFTSLEAHLQVVVNPQGRLSGLMVLPGAPSGRFGR